MALPSLRNEEDPVVKRLKEEGQLDRNSGTNSIKSLKEINSTGFKSLSNNLIGIQEVLQKQFELNTQIYRREIKTLEEEGREGRSKTSELLSGGALTSKNSSDSGKDGGGSSGGGGGVLAGAGLAGLATTIGSSLKSTFEKIFGSKPGKALSVGGKASNAGKALSVGGKGLLRFVPGLGAALSIADMASDAKVGVDTADKDGQSKLASGIGNFIGGGKGGLGNAATQGLKGAAIGATIGSVVPVLGTAIGGAIGGVVGGVAGFIGGEAITNTVDDVSKEIAGIFGETIEISPGRKKTLEKRVKESAQFQDKTLAEIESLTKTIDDTSRYSLEQRKAAEEKRKVLEEQLSANRELVENDKDTLVRSEMAVLDKQIESLKKKKDFTMEDQLQVEKLEKEKEKLRNSFDYQEDIGDKIGEVGNNIGKSFMEMVDGIGSLFGKKGPGRGQFSRRNNKKAPQVAMDALDPKQTLAMHEEYNSAIPKPPPILSGSTKSASLDPDYELETENPQTGVSTLPANRKVMSTKEVRDFQRRRRRAQRQNRGNVATEPRESMVSKQDLTPSSAKAILDRDIAALEARFDGPAFDYSKAQMGTASKSADFSEGTIGNSGKLVQDFGSGTPAMLHGKEAVLNEEQLGHLASSMSNENIMKIKEETGIKPEHFEEVLKQPTRGRGDKYDKKVLKLSDGTTLQYKPHDGTFIHSGGFGRLTYNSHGDLINYSTPSMGGLKLSKNLVSGDISQRYKTKMDGVGVDLGVTANRQGETIMQKGDFSVGGLTIGATFDKLAGTQERRLSLFGQREKETTNLGVDGVNTITKEAQFEGKEVKPFFLDPEAIRKFEADSAPELEALMKELQAFKDENQATNVVAPTDNSTVNNVVNNTQVSDQKPQARNNDGSSRRYGGSVSFSM